MIDTEMLKLVHDQAQEAEALAKKNKDPVLLKLAVGTTALVDMIADLDTRLSAIERVLESTETAGNRR